MPKCSKCEISKHCKTSLIKGYGCKENPTLVIVKESPCKEADETGMMKDTHESLKWIKQILGVRIEKTFITNLIKCCPYEDIVIRDKERPPISEEIDECFRFLTHELSMFKDAIIMPLGKTVLDALVPNNEGVQKEQGRLKTIKLNDIEYKIMPNFNPKAVKADPKVAIKFRQNIEKSFNIDKDSVIEDKYEILKPEDSLNKINEIIKLYEDKKIDYTIFDIETTAIKTWEGEIIMFSLAHELDTKAYSIPLMVTNLIHHENFSYPVPKIEWDVSPTDKLKILAALKKLLSIVPIVGHNLKFDGSWCVEKNIVGVKDLKIKDDTLNMAYLIYGRIDGVSLSLKERSRALFDIPEDWEAEIKEYINKFRLNKDKHFGNIPTGILGKYAALDAYYNRELYKYYKEDILPQMDHIRDILNKAIVVFIEAETKGIHINNDMREFLTAKYKEEQARILREVSSLESVQKIIEDNLIELRTENDKKRKPVPESILREEAFRITSNKHLQKFIFDDKYLGMEAKFLTPKKDPATHKEALAELKSRKSNTPEQAKFLKLLADYKIFAKLKSTYIDNLDEKVINNMYRPEYNITNTKTGRLSSGFHTLPKKSDIKRMYESRWATNGGLFMAPDASQLELRIAASLADEPLWLEAFNRGDDLHQTTGDKIAEISSVLDGKSKDDIRAAGKAINFGFVFGKGAHSTAEELNITEMEAQSIINGFFEGAFKLQKWVKSQHQYAMRNGAIITAFQRIIPIPETQSNIKKVVGEGKRRSVNNPVQSAASDIILSGITRHHQELKENRMKSLIVGSVHDSIEYDIYPGELPKMIMGIKRHFEEIPSNKYKSWLKCPLVIDIAIGSSWGSAVEFKVIEGDENYVILEGEGYSKSIKMLKFMAKKAYDVEIEILSREEVDQKKYRIDSYIRDDEKWKVKMKIKNKNNSK